MSETTEKPKSKASNGLTTDENETAMALALFRSIPKGERTERLVEAQMFNVGRSAYKHLADAYRKLTAKPLEPYVILDGQTGEFVGMTQEEFDEIDGDEDEDEDEDEDAIDATEGEDDEDTPAQAVRMLRKWMKTHGATQAYVARRLKVTQSAVSTWMQGTEPRESTVPRIIRLCSK